MTREEIYASCQTALTKSNCLLLEAATGTGKTRISLNLINWLSDAVYKGKKPRMLLLVAKRVHKQTWKEEFEKWGGIKVSEVVIECYESLRKHTDEFFEFIVLDEVHHIQSDARLDYLSTLKYGYMIGLSATIPRNLQYYFKYHYHAQVVSCDILEAIADDVLPEPEIILFPLKVETSRVSETFELHTKAPGPAVRCEYGELKKYKFKNVHVICKCTQMQKLTELNNLIEWYKNKAMNGNQSIKKTWLYFCGKRLEFLADCKLQWVKLILHRLRNHRTITFCKTIAQTEELGKNCIHSKNKSAEKLYENFNAGKINHITAVNILNENANLVNCKYAIFCNISSSDIVIPQRLGRAMRHKHPVIIVPYFKGTREQELVEKMFEGYNRNFIRTIKNINEI
jgi:superfamily II DNA or RNA helicase